MRHHHPPTRPSLHAAVAAALCATLGACIYVPRSTEVYDRDCQVYARHLDLATAQVGNFGRCQNDGCVALLVGMGAVAAASAVVSGSIVVTGNVVYWFEKQGRCVRGTAGPT